MRPFLDGTPDMYQSEQAEDGGGGYYVGLHELLLSFESPDLPELHFLWYSRGHDRCAAA
jgi:hypothetical protein